MFGTQWPVTSAMHALEQAADPKEVDAVVFADLVGDVVTGLSVLLLALVESAVVLGSILPAQAPALLSTSADTVHGAGHLALMPVLCALISS